MRARAGRLAEIAAAYSADELLAEKGVGESTLREIRFWLEAQGRSLRERT